MVNNETVALVSRSTYQFNNSTIFYSLINASFLPYYQTVIRKSQEWLDGYDPEFHKEDMVSSRIGAKLMNGFANSIFGRGLVFSKGRGTTENDNKALDFISHKWADKSDIQNATKQLIGYCLPLGTAALKLNKSAKNGCWVEALRNDYFYYTTVGKKQLNSFTCFIRSFQTTENENENYFLVERRYFRKKLEPFTKYINGVKKIFNVEKREPVVVYKVYKYTGTVNINTMPSSINESSSINYKQLPKYVKDSLAAEYGAYKIDVEQPLPFGEDNLGVELFFNEGGDITNPTMPVGRALVFDCLADFMEYDMEKSYSIRDLYNSKGIVGVPKGLTQSQVVPGTGGNMTKNSAFGNLNIPGYEVVNGLDPNTQKPIITQFEIRAQEHELKQMAILKSIAITVGVSPRAIASFLVQAGEKTDDQIQSEDDTITQWIKTHRQDYIAGLNRIVETVLNVEGISSNVEVKFASDGLLKGDKQLENIKARMEMGMLTLEDAIREYYPDLDEVQLQEKIAKAQRFKAQQEEDSMTEFDDMYGDRLHGEEN